GWHRAGAAGLAGPRAARPDRGSRAALAEPGDTSPDGADRGGPRRGSRPMGGRRLRPPPDRPPDPAGGLGVWAVDGFAAREIDPLGPRVLAMANSGTTVAAMANRLRLGARQLHRRCLPVFGYGPRRLSR